MEYNALFMAMWQHVYCYLYMRCSSNTVAYATLHDEYTTNDTILYMANTIAYDTTYWYCEYNTARYYTVAYNALQDKYMAIQCCTEQML